MLCPLLDAHDVLLDLHSFHAGGAPFVMIGPQNNSGTLEPFSHASEEMQPALCTGAPRIVEGWLDTYARGVLRRATAPTAAGTARAQTLALLGMTSRPLETAPAERDILRLVDVTDREHAGDQFNREWRSFDAVKAGELIGVRHGVEVKAPHDGFVVFPNPRAEPEQEWFYMARRRGLFQEKRPLAKSPWASTAITSGAYRSTKSLARL